MIAQQREAIPLHRDERFHSQRIKVQMGFRVALVFNTTSVDVAELIDPLIPVERKEGALRRTNEPDAAFANLQTA